MAFYDGGCSPAEWQIAADVSEVITASMLSVIEEEVLGKICCLL